MAMVSKVMVIMQIKLMAFKDTEGMEGTEGMEDTEAVIFLNINRGSIYLKVQAVTILEDMVVSSLIIDDDDDKTVFSFIREIFYIRKV